MPEPSPDDLDPELFAGSGDLATEITDIADGHILIDQVLHDLDPDQVGEDVLVKKRLGWFFWLMVAWLVVVVGAALLAPILPIPEYQKIFNGQARQAPSAEHWMGTDTIGRDVLSRIIWGARISLVVGVVSILFGMLIGGPVGLVAGYFRGRAEGVLMWAMDVLLAFPALLLSLAVITATGKRTVVVIALAIGVVAIPPLARLIRASTLTQSQREFVTASRASGAGNGRIMVREILPNVVLPVLSFSLLGVALAIVAEGGLAFLGLSVPPPTPTWGTMINDGRSAITTAPWIALGPCAVLFLTVLALNLAGDRLREHFDVKDGGL